MDPQIDLPDLVEDLEANIDDLAESLSPLLSNPIHTTASTLPLLDKAKLYVLSAYAIESLLFSSLQASGVNAKEHAIFQELARLKGYFGKIKQVESAGEQPKTRIDKEAAARFIKHGLAGNDKHDRERAERIAKEKAKAALKARQMNIKFDQAAEEAKQSELAKKRKAEEVERDQEEDGSSEAEDHVESENEEFYGSSLKGAESAQPAQEPARKKARVSASDFMDAQDDEDVEPPSSVATPTSAKKDKKEKKKKKDKKRKHSTTSSGAEPSPLDPNRSKAERKAAKLAKKNARRLRKAQSLGGVKKGKELVLPERAPQTHSETFNALLDGSFVEQKEKEKAKRKGKK